MLLNELLVKNLEKKLIQFRISLYEIVKLIKCTFFSNFSNVIVKLNTHHYAPETFKM